MNPKRSSGIILATGAAIKLSLGFRPDRVRLSQITDTSVMPQIDWHYRFASVAAVAGGTLRYTDSTARKEALLTSALGITPYNGGEIVASGNTTNYGPLTLLNLWPTGSLSVDQKAAGGTNILKWTLDTAANFTGHFDAGISTTYVKVGSIVEIGPDQGPIVRATITAITNTGTAADEITLDRAVPTGKVWRISYPYEFAALAAGTKTLEGITIGLDTKVNLSGKLVLVEAWADEMA